MLKNVLSTKNEKQSLSCHNHEKEKNEILLKVKHWSVK